MNTDYQKLIESTHDFPCEFQFKCIVPKNQLEDFTSRVKISDLKTSTKISKTGKYTSFTIFKTMQSSSQVMDFYQTLQAIDGVICL